MSEWTIGDVIRKARTARRWSQTKLGKEAASFQIGSATTPINKSTVSKVERDPYSSELGTVWRLLAALHLSFGEVETRIGAPFERRKAPAVTRHTARDARHAAADPAIHEAAEKRGRAPRRQT